MARPKTPYFPFWATEYLTDPAVRALTLEERGAFIEVLCWAWNAPRRGLLMHGNGEPFSDNFIYQTILQNHPKSEAIFERLLGFSLIHRSFIGNSSEVYTVENGGKTALYFNKRMVVFLNEYEQRNLKGKERSEWMSTTYEFIGNSSVFSREFIGRLSAHNKNLNSIKYNYKNKTKTNTSGRPDPSLAIAQPQDKASLAESLAAKMRAKADA